MNNLKMYLPLTNGSQIDGLHYLESGSETIDNLMNTTFGVSPKSLCLEVTTASGKTVCLTIPYNNDGNAVVTVNGNEL